MDMQTSKFGATVKLREHLARVQKMPRVEGAFQALLLLQVVLGELDGHQVALLNTHAVLPGQYTTHLHTAAQDVGAEFLGTLKLAGLVRIKQDQRMQIAVTSMEYIGHAQAVLLAERCHPAHHVGKTATRNCAVHAQIVRRNAAHSRESGFATGPEQVALFFRLADPHRAGTRLAGSFYLNGHSEAAAASSLGSGFKNQLR